MESVLIVVIVAETVDLADHEVEAVHAEEATVIDIN